MVVLDSGRSRDAEYPVRFPFPRSIPFLPTPLPHMEQLTTEFVGDIDESNVSCS